MHRWTENEKMASLCGEIRVKTTVKYYLIPFKISNIFKIQKVARVGKKEKLELLCIVSWIARWSNLHEEAPHKVTAPATV